MRIRSRLMVLRDPKTNRKKDMNSALVYRKWRGRVADRCRGLGSSLALHTALLFVAATTVWIKQARQEQISFEAEKVLLAQAETPQGAPERPVELPLVPTGVVLQVASLPLTNPISAAVLASSLQPAAATLSDPIPLPRPPPVPSLGANGIGQLARVPGMGKGGGLDGSLSTSVQFDADYILLTYEFSAGRDLDTYSEILDAASMAGNGMLQTTTKDLPLPLGFDCNSGMYQPARNSYFYWAGDNTGVGFESVLVDVRRLAWLYPRLEEFAVDCRAYWFETPSIKPVTVRATLIKGGEMQARDFCFQNKGCDAATVIGARSKSIRVMRGSTQRIAVLVYNLRTKEGRFEENYSGTMKWEL